MSRTTLYVLISIIFCFIYHTWIRRPTPESLGTQTIEVTNEVLQHVKEAKRKRAAHVEECEQRKRGKRSPSNDRRIKQSAPPANEQHVEGTHPPSLQPPSSEENVTEEHQV